MKYALVLCIILFTSCSTVSDRDVLNHSIERCCERLMQIDENLSEDAYNAFYAARNTDVGEADAFLMCRVMLKIVVLSHLREYARIVSSEHEVFIRLYQCRDILRVFDEENQCHLIELRLRGKEF